MIIKNSEDYLVESQRRTPKDKQLLYRGFEIGLKDTYNTLSDLVRYLQDIEKDFGDNEIRIFCNWDLDTQIEIKQWEEETDKELKKRLKEADKTKEAKELKEFERLKAKFEPKTSR